MNLNEWALRWSVTPQALNELHLALGLDHDPDQPPEHRGKPITSEAGVVSMARLEASRVGGKLWRNNNGAATMADGSFVRYGLCNDSAEINAVIKSSDLIGIRPTIVTPDMVGTLIGRFWARECKEPGWRYTGTEREAAQLRFIGLITKLGGDAGFWNGHGEL